MDTIEGTGLQLLPPHPDACQVCARRPAHPPDQPHDATTLYYQYKFWMDNGRWPTWKDAVAHCAPEVQREWESLLRRKGKWTEPEPEGERP